MAGKIELPNAQELQRQASLKELEKADAYVRLLTEAELEKRAFVEGLASEDSGEDGIRLASAIIRRAAQSGLVEVQLLRFSSALCTDGGFAIGSKAAGWENTLTGVPQRIYRLWSDYLRPRGYQIRYGMNESPRHRSSYISVVVSWEI